MFVGIGIEAEKGVNHLIPRLLEMEERLKKFFDRKSYGAAIDNIFIGLIIISREGSVLHPKRKMKFKRSEKVFYPDGSIAVLSNVLTYDVSVDFELLGEMSELQSMNYVSSRILAETRKTLEQTESRFIDFDIQSFLADFENILRSD